jgi:hypothetical protein
VDELTLSAPSTSATETLSRPRARLVKTHEFSVAYPDGTTGSCSYERLGPAYHRFDFRYFDGKRLPRQYWTLPLMNCQETIEEAGRARAEDAFKEAIEVERKDYFARATEPTDGSRKANPKKFRLSAKQAKEMGGKYALCIFVGSTLLPVTRRFDTLQEANARWIEKGNPALFVACCNRLDRCWGIPRYSPLYKEHPQLKEVKQPCLSS